MRNLTKMPIPKMLEDNHVRWTADHIADPANGTKKYRYRNSEIKEVLLAETSSKCVYCESKIGHNTPGDVEHKTPSSVDRNRHYEWQNLTVACTECNRRKNAYFSAAKPFLDPYTDDVESLLIHLGPVVCWKTGESAAEVTVRTLELNTHAREELVARKIEKIDALNNLVERMQTSDPLLSEMMKIQIRRMMDISSEYSAMVMAICDRYGIVERETELSD